MTRRRWIAPSVLAVLAMLLWMANGWVVAQATGTESTEAVARRYMEETFNRRYEALPYAEDALFEDPTGDIFENDPQLVEGTRGREAIVALQRSWNLDETEFQIEQQFFVGQYALFRGKLTVSYKDDPGRLTMTLVTILRVVDGKVTERHDYGSYADAFGANEAQRAIGVTTKSVADRYLAAYLDQRHDDARKLLAADATLQDPTAAVFGGPQSGAMTTGADAIVERRKRAFSAIEEFHLDIDASFTSTHHTVYMGRTRYTMPGSAVGSERASVELEHSAVFVIGVRNGRVVYHRDYVDYSNYRAQLMSQRKPIENPNQ